ncbi:MAG: uracil-DNA glycosylase [Firmicutes bacterium]|nr:uracil-DNA glycosylase [Bacillota bacterium]
MSGESELAALRQQAEACRACPLSRGRHRVVFGEGDPHARLAFVGEAPGEQEDMQGRPFVGAAGQLLDRILAAAGIARSEVYITNTVMCRPPGNRVPTEEERAACRPFFDAKMRLIAPRIVVLLGATAAQSVLGPGVRITRDRGRPVERQGVTYVPTFHPAALLRDPSKKRPVWEDIQRVRDLYRSLPPEGHVPEHPPATPSASTDGRTPAEPAGGGRPGEAAALQLRLPVP